MTLALLIAGALALAAQVLLLRELSVAFFGVELSYVLGLGVWLLGCGLGALLAPRRGVPRAAGLAALFLAFAAVLPAEMVFLRGLRTWLGGTPGAFLPIGRAFAGLLFGLLPPAAIAGLLFAWAARRAISGGSSFPRTYAVESLGSLAGGLALTAALASGLPALALAVSCSLVALAGASVALRDTVRWAPRRTAFLAAGLLSVLAASGWLDRELTRRSHPSARAVRDTPYARVMVAERLGQVSVFVNDALAFDSEGSEAEAFVQPVLLAHPAPLRIAVLGGAAEGLVQEALAHAPQRIDAVEMDGDAFDLVRAWLPAPARRALDAPAVRLIREDPRRFLTSAGPFDVILVGVGDPDSGQTNRLYTREFFALCAARLTPGGLVGLRLRSSENLWTPQLARRMASVDGALRAAFDDVLWLPGATDMVLASPAPIPRDPEVFAARIAERRLNPRLVSAALLRYLLTNDRAARVDRLRAMTRSRANSDSHPICYTHAALLWLARFFPRVAFGEAEAALLSFAAGRRGWTLAATGLAVVALIRRRPRARSIALAFVAGLLGMLSEAVLVLHHQARAGALFRDLGLLLTAFMAGMALGAWGVDAVERRRGRVPLLGAGLLVVAAALHAGFALLVGAGGGLAGAAIAGLLASSGFCVGGLLAHASAIDAPAEHVVSPLYAADLAGGCLGAVVGALVLVPLAGLVATALMVAALACAALLLV